MTEEIKWNPADTDADSSIFDRVDDFIELPAEEVIRIIRNEQITGTPEQRNRAHNLDELWRADTYAQNFNGDDLSGRLSEISDTVIQLQSGI